MSSVGSRPRKRHEQMPLLNAAGTKKADPRKGKARGGRPRKGPRGCPSHKKRVQFSPNQPVHVTLRVLDTVGSLRRRFLYAVLRAATFVAAAKHAARIIHISIQKNHIHLIVEAAGAEELSRTIQGLEISAAKGINRQLGKQTGKKRRGQVFDNRYHVEIIRTPRQARHALAYVLNNWRKHDVNREDSMRGWKIDPWSTGWKFEGWKEGLPRDRERFPDGYEHLVVGEATSWLLRTGWRRYGLVSMYEKPSAGVFVRRMAKRDAQRWREVERVRQCE